METGAEVLHRRQKPVALAHLVAADKSKRDKRIEQPHQRGLRNPHCLVQFIETGHVLLVETAQQAQRASDGMDGWVGRHRPGDS